MNRIEEIKARTKDTQSISATCTAAIKSDFDYLLSQIETLQAENARLREERDAAVIEPTPLTLEQLKEMDNQFVWVISLDGNGNPEYDMESDAFKPQWHTVNSKDKIIVDNNKQHYEFEYINKPYGFIAYTQPITNTK